MSIKYEIGAVVWVRLGQKWWPGRVSSLDECPSQYINDLKKEPLAVVRFFNESGFYDVTKSENLLPYTCNRKNDLIRKGLNAVKYDSSLNEKFEADVTMAEKLTGGNMEIVKEFKEVSKRRIDYTDLGFGTSKPKRPARDQSVQRRGFSDIGEAIIYKRGISPVSTNVIEHKVKIMEQPKQKTMEEEVRSAANWFKCYQCGFTCGRLNVIIWHNKGHLKKVADYDSGIRIPGRRKRRIKAQRNRSGKGDPKSLRKVDHSQTNGEASPKDTSQEASQLLLDWQDDDDEEEEGRGSAERKENGRGSADVAPEPIANGIDSEEESDGESGDEYDESDEDDDDDYPLSSIGQRQPMPKQVDINSAFDALLAESSPLHRSNLSNNSSYVNNDSDSDCSGWEKYYAEDESEDDSDAVNGPDEERRQNGDCSSGSTSKRDSEKSSKQRRRRSSVNSESYSKKTYGKGDAMEDTIESSESSRREKNQSSKQMKGGGKTPARPSEEAVSPPSPGPSISKSSSPAPERSREEPSEEHSTHSSNSSTSSGPAYMLVAVDAHGNNVPMPVLSEGGNHLVAVEASMEDGTSRTLYIDPAHLGPNVDLNNLMLHIDNSGQETVIIPTSTSDGEIISSTLVEPSTQEEEFAVQPPLEGATQSEEPPPRQDLEAERLLKESSPSPEKPNQTEEVVVIAPPKSEETVVNAAKTEEEREEAKRQKREEKKKERKKIEKETAFQFHDPIEISKDDDDEDDELLPDLEEKIPKHELFSSDEVVWVMTHGLWWPSFVLKIYPKENKASILFINCQQKTPIKVSLNRLKSFTYLDYTDIFSSQEDKAVGLTDAMEMANHYRTLKEAHAINETPREFFALPRTEQRSIINRQMLVLRGVPLEVETPDIGTSNKCPESPVMREEEVNVDVGENNGTKTSTPIISEDHMSERDIKKLASATKARRTSNERFVRFIKTEDCLNHLRQICQGKIFSQRHQYFKENYRNSSYLLGVSGVHSTGIDFFGDEDTQQIEDVLLFLFKTFEEEELEFPADASQRNMYVNTVLLPEAIKESLRVLTKLPEEELETAVEKGLSLTKTEVKARRLDYS